MSYNFPETKKIGPWTIQWNDTWRCGSYVCYLGDCLMMSAETMEAAEEKVRQSMEKMGIKIISS